MKNVSACRFLPTDHGSICNSNISKSRVTTFWLDTLAMYFKIKLFLFIYNALKTIEIHRGTIDKETV